MSSDSGKALSDAGTALGALYGGGTWGAIAGSQAGQLVAKTLPDAPSPQSPPPAPSPGAATQVGINTDLDHESKMYSASTILTGGQGLDDKPTTASRVLLGS